MNERFFASLLVLPLTACAAAAVEETSDGSRGPEETGEVTEAASAGYSDWNCFRTSDGKFFGRTTIWWGHTPGDATWACNNWVSACGNAAGGCTASGDAPSKTCDMTTRTDGCSIPLNDPQSNQYKVVFAAACNAHDTCYHAPWSRILGVNAGDGFNRCNDSFWNDMNAACDTVPWYDYLVCKVTASVWADAMNLQPGRAVFWNSFYNDQLWVHNNCVQ
ncbi:hypothetical protein WMF37_12665 [Sorangium sp. So ce291]|uniref:hypothetical protein n=1 Tax=Sorangium sp. So ce291 TaxID=3133294 RepID=UPI003F617404